MRRWIAAVARLYPSKWRERYGAEFNALLEDVEPGWRQLVNVLGGALRMQLSMGDGLYLKLAAIFAVLGMTVAAGLSLTARSYVSSASFRIALQSDSQPTDISDQPLVSAIQVATSRTHFSELIQRPELDLYRKERAQKPLEDVIAQMQHDFRITRMETKDHSLVVRINFLYQNPQKARQVVNAFLTTLVRSIARQPKSARAGGINMTVLEPASAPAEPMPAQWPVYVGTGLALGAFSGLLTTYYLRRTRRAALFTALALAGAILGIAISFLFPSRYVSSAVVRIVPVDAPASTEAANRLQQTAATILSKSNLPDLKLELIRPGERFRVKPEEASAMAVRFESTDRNKAQAIVQAVATELTLAGAAGTVEYLDQASYPESPVFPNRAVISAMGAAACMLLGAARIWSASRRRQPLFA